MSVIIQMWRRLVPSRTKKLSTSWVMILRLTGRGKVAHCGLVNSLIILTLYIILRLFLLLVIILVFFKIQLFGQFGFQLGYFILDIFVCDIIFIFFIILDYISCVSFLQFLIIHNLQFNLQFNLQCFLFLDFYGSQICCFIFFYGF